MTLALVTGGSAGLGLALIEELSAQGWQIVTDGRDTTRLRKAGRPGVTTVAGDVADTEHRRALAEVIGDRPLDLLVNNASSLGQLPLPRLWEADLAAIGQSYQVNVLAPLGLIQLLRTNLLAATGTVVNVSSDAALAGYDGWGGYGSGKAALDQLTRTLATETPELAWYSVDPGDLRTEMHQAAFPGQDISDRPLPGTVVPKLLALLESRPESGRYQLANTLSEEGVSS